MPAAVRELIDRDQGVFAPLVLNPLMARLAEAAGHEALYLGGGQLGYEQAILEANLNITDVAQRGLAIRSVTELPLILDGATGFGDPMHMHRTIPMDESAGFAAGWPPPRSLRDPPRSGRSQTQRRGQDRVRRSV